MADALSTPKRASQCVLQEIHPYNDTRRSLFEKGDSDLSDISPLSRTSSELLSPVKISPIPIVTPLRMRGVKPLSPDHGLIKPSTFYGTKSPTRITDGAEMYRQIRKSVLENSKARTCLFLDNLPRNKKRSRSSGDPNKSLKQTSKKIKLQPNLRHDVRKPSKREIRQREILKRKKALKELKERKRQEKLEKLHETKRKYSWEIFNTSEDLHKYTWRSSVVMTPPRSTKKKRLLPNDIFMSPQKPDTTLTKEKSKELVVKEEQSDILDEFKEIREGVLDMMKDDEEDEVSREVSYLLDRLGKPEEPDESVKEESKMIKPLNLVNDENIDPSTPPKEKWFPVFDKTPNCGITPVPKATLELSSQKPKLGMGLNQLQLDVGQNKLKEVECAGCGLMYVQGNPEDMAEHELFHFKFKELHYNGWKNERVVRNDGANKIVCVRDTDCRQWWKKGTNVLEIIDSELGYPPNGPQTTQIYMYICGKFIRGVAAVSYLTKAHKMLHIEGSDDVGLCSEEEYPVKCLISRIWVDNHFRRCNIATSLLDSVRCNFTFGYILKCSDMAFSSPTEDGRKFIEAYTKTKEYYVYT
ncbi:establishment of cohesion [Rhodnius prolixus]|uniref:establishment of cohesion n=1 Tax=Rhodnius prolixus TaxID=13249 RepID=UPI003D1881F8